MREEFPCIHIQTACVIQGGQHIAGRGPSVSRVAVTGHDLDCWTAQSPTRIVAIQTPVLCQFLLLCGTSHAFSTPTARASAEPKKSKWNHWQKNSSVQLELELQNASSDKNVSRLCMEQCESCLCVFARCVPNRVGQSGGMFCCFAWSNWQSTPTLRFVTNDGSNQSCWRGSSGKWRNMVGHFWTWQTKSFHLNLDFIPKAPLPFACFLWAPVQLNNAKWNAVNLALGASGSPGGAVW